MIDERGVAVRQRGRIARVVRERSGDVVSDRVEGLHLVRFELLMELVIIERRNFRRRQYDALNEKNDHDERGEDEEDGSNIFAQVIYSENTQDCSCAR